MSIAIMDETLSYLRFNCIWPPKGQDLQPKFSFYIKFTLMILSTVIILIGSTLHLIVSLQHNSRHNISEDLVMMIAEIGAYYFLAIFVRYQKEIAQIYVDLSNFDRFGRPPHFDERNKQLLNYSRAYKAFIDSAIITFCTLPYFLNENCEKNNRIGEVCGLLVATWYPFSLENRVFLFLFFYLWQSYTILMSLKAAAVISFAIMETMEHLVIRLQHLKMLLEEALNSDISSMERRAKFTKAVEYHIDIFKMGAKADRCYKGCLFLHLLLSGALFGCIGYRFMEGFSINAFCLFSGWLMSLYIVCVSGQHLMDEATSVADIVYNSRWYEIKDINLRKSIAFVIKRSQKPVVIHTGPFSNVSHVIVLSIFKTAYSYMTLLNTTSA